MLLRFDNLCFAVFGQKGRMMMLEQLFNMTVKETQSHHFEQLLASHGDRIVLFGAGNLSSAIIKGLKEKGNTPLALSDNNQKKWGLSIDGIPILSPESVSEKYGDNAIVVVTIWNANHSYKKTLEQLSQLGCKQVIPFQIMLWAKLKELLPRFCIDFPQKMLKYEFQIKETSQNWHDERSRIVFQEHLAWRFFPDTHFAPEPIDGVQYQPSDLFELTTEDIFNDCGAFDGDTIESLMENGVLKVGHITAYEPDPLTFKILTNKWSAWGEKTKSQVTLINKAVGANKGFLKFSAEGSASSSFNEDGDESVEVTTVDSLDDGKIPTVLKFDVEGAELSALEGAKTIIRQYHPIICVALYHRQNDIWKIPLFIKKLYPDYLLFLRQHFYDGLELVCYAVPRNRFNG